MTTESGDEAALNAPMWITGEITTYFRDDRLLDSFLAGQRALQHLLDSFLAGQRALQQHDFGIPGGWGQSNGRMPSKPPRRPSKGYRRHVRRLKAQAVSS